MSFAGPKLPYLPRFGESKNCLAPCKKSGKNNEPIQRKRNNERTNGRTDGRTNGAEFIGLSRQSRESNKDLNFTQNQIIVTK